MIWSGHSGHSGHSVERIILKGHLKLSTSVAQMNDTPLIVDIVFLNKQLKNEIK